MFSWRNRKHIYLNTPLRLRISSYTNVTIQYTIGQAEVTVLAYLWQKLFQHLPTYMVKMSKPWSHAIKQQVFTKYLKIYCTFVTCSQHPVLETAFKKQPFWMGLECEMAHPGQIQQTTIDDIFSCCSQKMGFDISCKLSLQETICMKSQSQIFWKK